jgi:hypothetical protein
MGKKTFELPVHALFAKIRRYFLGEDIFISYYRDDATDYATALATHFTDAKLSCLFDQWCATPGERVPKWFLRAVRDSSLCVLIFTENAGKSVRWPLVAGLKWEHEDPEAFATGRPSAKVISRINRACTRLKTNSVNCVRLSGQAFPNVISRKKTQF